MNHQVVMLILLLLSYRGLALTHTGPVMLLWAGTRLDGKGHVPHNITIVAPSRTILRLDQNARSPWLLTTGGFAAQALNEKNWINHPDIVEVRSVYQKVNEDKNEGKLRKKKRIFQYCRPYEDTVRTLYTAQDGTPRIYYYQGGSDDSSVRRELYYDESGKLRFALIIAGASNGTKLEHRIYLSKAGEKIWETQKRLEGPGYTFPTEWPDEELIRNPLQAFNDKNACPERK